MEPGFGVHDCAFQGCKVGFRFFLQLLQFSKTSFKPSLHPIKSPKGLSAPSLTAVGFWHCSISAANTAASTLGDSTSIWLNFASTPTPFISTYYILPSTRSSRPSKRSNRCPKCSKSIKISASSFGRWEVEVNKFHIVLNHFYCGGHRRDCYAQWKSKCLMKTVINDFCLWKEDG